MINVAILGFGTVGSGVADVLTMNAASIETAMSMIAGTARSMGIEVVD
jgi:homoserine dehydrogenase